MSSPRAAARTAPSSGGGGEPPPPPFRVRLSANAEQKASGYALATKTHRPSHLITSVTPSLGLDFQSRKINATVNYDLGYDTYAFTKDRDGFRHNGAGVAKAELIDQHLFLDTRFSVTEQKVNPTGPTTADNRPSASNRTRVTTVSASPRLEQRLGRWGVGQISYQHDETHNETPTATRNSLQSLGATSNTLANAKGDSGKLEVRSGEEFSQFLWDYASNISHQLQGALTLDQISHSFGSEYRINNDFGVLSEIGHDTITGDQINSSKLSGVFYSGGMHWTPSPDVDLRLGWGRRNGGDNIYVLGEHKITPMTTLRLSSKTNITNDAMNFIEALNTMQRDETGAFISPFSGATANPSASQFSRSDAIYRQRISSIMLSHAFERNIFSLTGNMSEQTVVGGGALRQNTLLGANQGANSTSMSFEFQWTHEWTPSTSVVFNANKEDVLQTNSLLGKSQRYRVGLGLSNKLSPTVTTNLSYRFADSELDKGDATKENMISVSLKKQF
ncbi:TIGR03016 family PEP-CTERM system-associated outer membrane protein [Azospirillaceae bacterium]